MGLCQRYREVCVCVRVCSRVLIKFGYMFRALKCYKVYLKCGSRQCPQPLSQSVRRFYFTLQWNAHLLHYSLCVLTDFCQRRSRVNNPKETPDRDPSDPMTELHDSHRYLKLFLYELRIKSMVITHFTTELHPESYQSINEISTLYSQKIY